MAAHPHIDSNADAREGAASVTIVVTPRERFGVAVESLESIIELTNRDFDLVYIDGNSPPEISSALRSACDRIRDTHSVRFERTNHFLSPNQARNKGQRLANTKYVVFVDNDVIVSSGWLDHLVECAEETHADVVAPLTCQRLPLHTEIHQAGGEFADDLQDFLAAPASDRRITDVHLLQGKKVGEVELERGETQCCEFHCALVRKDAFKKYGELDENLLATKEHIDFCLTIWSSGGRVMFEPRSIVTYLFPSRSSPMTAADWKFFALRWSPEWQRRSLEHFQRKWSLFDDPYFEGRKPMLRWRLTEGIAKPLLNNVPGLNRSYTAKKWAASAMAPVLEMWSRRLVAAHRKGPQSDTA